MASENKNTQKKTPPRWASRLLPLCCPRELYEEVRGDIDEMYRYRLEKYSKFKADLAFTWEVISSIKLRFVGHNHSFSPHYQKDHTAMLSNYLKIAYRNIVKHKAYSSINISGLAIGLTSFMLIFLWVNDEVSYDLFQEKSDRIAKIGMVWAFGDTKIPTARATTIAGPGLKNEIPYVEEFVRLKRNSTNESTVLVNDQSFTESSFYFADSAFFDLFSFRLLSGNPDGVLTRPNTVVLTESIARKYFSNENPVGKSIIVGTSNPEAYEVTGVMEDVPKNSHMQFDVLASFISLPEANEMGWNRSSYHTYVLLTNEDQMNQLQEDADRVTSDYFENSNIHPTLTVLPFNDVYLRSPHGAEMIPGGDIRYVYIFSAIALLIVFIACINYMNLATARATDRAREVGMRKTLGAFRTQLIGQFMGETLLITILGLTIAIVGTTYLMPFFNDLTGKELALNWVENFDLLLLLIAIGLGVSFVAGSYPAFMLSRFEPAKVLKGSFKFSSSGVWLRKGLVVVQFCISITLIVGTIVIFQQLDFIQNKKLGYNKEQILTVPLNLPDESRSSIETLKQVINNVDGVSNVTVTSHIPIQGTGARTFNNGETEATRQIFNTIELDEHFLATMEIELVSGTNVPPGSAQGERMGLILNEAAAKSFGWTPDEAIGKRVNSLAYGRGAHGEVYGVVKDFNYESLHKTIEPLILVYYEGYSYRALSLLAKVNTDNLPTLIASVRNQVEAVVPGIGFDYSFLDDEFDSIYSTEQQTGFLFSLFAGIAIFIACLGLFGLASYTAVQRSKEIGIRKVLGATVSSIVTLISYDFAKLIGIAIVVSLPVSWFIMNQWLNDFAYKINIGWEIMLLGSTLTILVAWLTIGYQSVQAAVANPIDSLKSE